MYIYESKYWADFVWDKDYIAEKLLLLNKQAGYLAGRLSDIGFDNRLQIMSKTIESDIVDSYSIEGINLNNDEVRSSVARKLGVKIKDDKEPVHYVDGIVEMMLDATTNYQSLLTEERLFYWHTLLFPNATKGIIIGNYRKSGMKVISGMFGREKIHYIAPNCGQVPLMMKDFLQWFNKEEKNITYLKSAIAHLWFVSIHPFEDGNGRMARAISDMALSQADDSKMRFFSMSNQINAEKKRYYDILERTQKSDGDITEWLDWYLSCMQRAIEKANKDLSTTLKKTLFWKQNADKEISTRQREILNIYLDGYEGFLTVKNWAKLTETSQDTAMRDIKDLVEKHILKAKDNAQRNIKYDIVIE